MKADEIIIFLMSCLTEYKIAEHIDDYSMCESNMITIDLSKDPNFIKKMLKLNTMHERGQL